MRKLTRRTIRSILAEPESINFINEEYKRCSDYRLSSFTKRVCEHFGFVDCKDELRIGSCRVVLLDLKRSGKVKLPDAVGARSHRPPPKIVRVGEAVTEAVGIGASVKELRDLKVILVGRDDVELRKIWNELMIREHPQGVSRLIGCQVKYLIKGKGYWLGGASFSASALNLEARDTWLGWDTEKRLTFQDRVVNMSRFLIRNSLNCKNLCSRVLRLIFRRLGSDFEANYGYRPWLIESFVDTSHFSGGCYRGSNWKFVGWTKGRGRNSRSRKDKKPVKAIYIYELDRDYRAKMGLGEAPAVEAEEFVPLDVDKGVSSTDWANHEFGKAELGDQRLTTRLVKIATARGNRPSSVYPEAVNGDRYAIKGYYKFLGNDNEELNDRSVLKPHKERTVQRILAKDRVISIQDTTDLNYHHLKRCENLGIISKNKGSKGTKGLKLHSTLVVDTNGIPLGVIDKKCYAPKGKTSQKGRDNIPIEEKESYRWLESYRNTIDVAKRCRNTQIVSVMDREADIYEIYAGAISTDNKVPVVIRARHNRVIEDSELKLFEKLDACKDQFEATIQVPRQRSREGQSKKAARPSMAERTATLTISYEEVTLRPPSKSLKKNLAPIKLYAVYAREKNTPKDCEPISWFLLTTLPIKSNNDAFDCVQIYKRRWRIEEYHRVLKSGCKVEAHNHTKAAKLKIMAAIDIVVAWRVMLLTLLGREHPELPCEIMFDKCEWQALELRLKKKFQNNAQLWVR